jgi:hypothetical protein
MPFLLKVTQGLQAGAELLLAPGIQKPELPAKLARQRGAIFGLTVLKLQADLLKVFGLAEDMFDAVLDVHATRLEGMANLVQHKIRVLGRARAILRQGVVICPSDPLMHSGRLLFDLRTDDMEQGHG